MTQLTITTKGQVTLKKDILTHLGVGPGQKIEVEVLPGARLSVRAAPAATLEGFIGCLSPTPNTSLTLDDMERITAEGWSKG